jgi:hypothetical protein
MWRRLTRDGTGNMARPKDPRRGGAELRAYLLAEAEGIRDRCVNIGASGGPPAVDGRPRTPRPDLAALVFDELDKPCRALREGLPYRFHRGDLPDWHPLRDTGVRLYDELELGADDVLRELD